MTETFAPVIKGSSAWRGKELATNRSWIYHFTPAQLQEIAVKQATVACKAEAKGKKIRWPASRKYVKNCITTALKDHPTMNISEVRRGVNVKTLRVHQRPEWGCEGMTSGRATGC